MRLILTILMFITASSFANSPDLSIHTLGAPIPAQTSNKQLLVYELQIVNKGSKTRSINRIEIRDNHNKLLKTYVRTELMNNSFVYDTKPIKEDTISLREKMGAFIYIKIELPKNSAIPTQLHHKIWSVSLDKDKSYARVRTLDYMVPVQQEPLLILGAPLTGKNWVAGAAIDSYHRRAILPIDGKFYLAQRFAIDWQQIVDGKASHGNMHENKNWYCFGQKILAAADGKVVNMSDVFSKDNLPPQLPAPTNDINRVPGNFITLQVKQNGKDYYVFYAHMQPGSLKVKLGDMVKKGQVIGILGNTGNSSAPHLHMHVSTSKEPLKTNGLPYVFEEFKLMGIAHSIDDEYGIYLPEYLAQPKIVRKVIPSAEQIVDFE